MCCFVRGLFILSFFFTAKLPLSFLFLGLLVTFLVYVFVGYFKVLHYLFTILPDKNTKILQTNPGQ